jgi:anti-sigma B factor antagonist
MEMSTEHREGIAVVSVRGSVDATNAPVLADRLAEVIDGGTARIAVDCRALSYISSAGLRAVLGALKKAKAASGELVLAAPQVDVERVLEISGFTKLLRLYPDLDGALSGLRS